MHIGDRLTMNAREIVVVALSADTVEYLDIYPTGEALRRLGSRIQFECDIANGSLLRT